MYKFSVFLLVIVFYSMQSFAAEMRRNIEKSRPKPCDEKPCDKPKHSKWLEGILKGQIGEEKAKHILRDRR